MNDEATPGALGSNEGLGAWSRSAPTEPGRYWVWQDDETWPCRGLVHLVIVERLTLGLCAWVPFMDYAEPVACGESENTWMDALWLGPVEVPQAPNVGVKAAGTPVEP